MRSAFLIRAGLSKEAFIATGVVIACLIDVSRLSVYAAHVQASNATLLAVATLAAFTGAFAGSRLMRKVTLRTVQTVVAVMLVVIGVALAAGLV